MFDFTLHVGAVEVSFWAAFALGTAVGVVAGMFGVGGGFLLVPLLNALLGVPMVNAVASGLCQTIATGLGSFLRYRSLGHAESRFDILLLGGSLLGVDAGTRLLHALSSGTPIMILGHTVPLVRVVLTILYVVLFAILAHFMWWKNPESNAIGTRVGPLTRATLGARTFLPIARISVSGPIVGIVGFINGVLAGMLGIGGGIMLIPIMLYGFGFNILQTAGTGNIVVLAVAVIGTVQHAFAHTIHLGLAMTLTVGAGLSAQVGASLTRRLPGRTLRRGLAIVLIITAAVLVLRLLR